MVYSCTLPWDCGRSVVQLVTGCKDPRDSYPMTKQATPRSPFWPPCLFFNHHPRTGSAGQGAVRPCTGARTRARHPLPPAAMALGLTPIPDRQARGLPTSPTEVVTSSHHHGPSLTISMGEQATVSPDCFRHLPAELGSLSCLILKSYP